MIQTVSNYCLILFSFLLFPFLFLSLIFLSPKFALNLEWKSQQLSAGEAIATPQYVSDARVVGCLQARVRTVDG